MIRKVLEFPQFRSYTFTVLPQRTRRNTEDAEKFKSLTADHAD